MRFSGNAITIQGEHINADSAMGWYLGMDALPPGEIAARFMVGCDKTIAGTVQKGDILVCGRDFGFGKIHNSFWTALNYIGIDCIVAESFSTQMLQMAIKNGKYLIECPHVLSFLKKGEHMEADLELAEIQRTATGEILRGKPMPEFLVKVMLEGGQQGFLKKRIMQKLGQGPMS